MQTKGLLAVGVLGALVLASTTGATPRLGVAGGVIHACVETRGDSHTIGDLKLNNCHRGFRRISWNIRGSRGPAGSRGPKGDTGPTGPAGPKGDTGSKGDTGLPGASALDPVPSGQTIRGAIGGDYHAFDNSASDFGVDMTFPMPAPVGVSDSEVFVNVAGWQDAGGQTPPTTTDTNAGCTGTPNAPTAPAGKVCIYVSGADHAFNLAGDSVLFGTGASKYGFKLKWDASQAGDTFVDATWAYTAP